MSVPVREPFFLRGRRGLVLRAMFMSVVLAGLGWVAGLAAGVLMFVTFLAGQVDGLFLQQLTVACAAVSLALAAGIPYFRWSGASLPGVIARVLWIVAASAGPWWVAGDWFSEQIERLNVRWELQKFSAEWLESLFVPMELVIPAVLAWLVWSLACVRRTWIWPLATCLSAASIPLWIASLNLMMYSYELAEDALPESVLGVSAMVAQASFISPFFVFLLLPWGVPLWRPAKSNEPPVAPS